MNNIKKMKPMEENKYTDFSDILSRPPIIIGAYGFTGKIITKKFQDAGITFHIAGRSFEKLEELKEQYSKIEKVMVCDLENDHDLDHLIEEGSLLINCVGPYELTSKKIMEKVSQKKGIYFDITGELPFVKWVHDHLGEKAQKNSALLLNSLAFESFLADILADEVCEKDEQYEDISSFYSFGGAKPSPGTMFTMRLAKYVDNVIYKDKDFVPMAPLSTSKEVDFFSGKIEEASFTPYPEVLFYSQKYDTKNASSYMLAFPPVASTPEKLTEEKKKELMSKQQKAMKRYKGPTDDERKIQKCQVGVMATKDSQKKDYIKLTTHDPYGVTGEIILQCYQYLLKKSDQLPVGHRIPSEVFNSHEMLGDLARRCSFEISQSP